jgi:hypothetical protein
MNDDQIIYKNIYKIKYRGIKLRKKLLKILKAKQITIKKTRTKINTNTN